MVFKDQVLNMLAHIEDPDGHIAQRHPPNLLADCMMTAASKNSIMFPR
jgi:hypothetical protein